MDEETACGDDAWGYMAEDDDFAYYEYDDGAWDDDEFEEYDADAACYNETLADPAEDDYSVDPAEHDGCYALQRALNEQRISCCAHRLQLPSSFDAWHVEGQGQEGQGKGPQWQEQLQACQAFNEAS